MFDDRNLVSHAGLVPVLQLADRAGLTELIGEYSSVLSANVVPKVRTVLAGMLAGADSIDDLDLLRAGGTERAIGAVRAPSTVGTFLRSFTHGHVLQLGKVNRLLLRRLIGEVPALTGTTDGLVFVDMDDTIRQVHGYQKQAAAFGYSGVHGLNGLLVTVTGQDAAPVIAEASLRRGNVRSGDNAAHHLTRALKTVKATSPGRQVLTRADSAFCTHENVATALKQNVWFSFTTPQWKTVETAIADIPETEWTRIEYPNAIYDEDSGDWISDAEVAETPFTAFVSRRKSEQIACRLVVRRVKRLGENTTEGQQTLFDTWRHHAFITNSTLTVIDADRFHRGHAIVEQVIAELKAGPLAHLPSGKFTANAAWLQFAVIAHNLARAASTAAGLGRARMATLLRKIVATPARLATTSRRLTSTSPPTGPGRMPGHGSGTPRRARHAPSPADRHRPNRPDQEPKWKSQHPAGGPRTPKPRAPTEMVRTTATRKATVDQGSVHLKRDQVPWLTVHGGQAAPSTARLASRPRTSSLSQRRR